MTNSNYTYRSDSCTKVFVSTLLTFQRIKAQNKIQMNRDKKSETLFVNTHSK